jgi:hypothetical protein
MSVPDMSTPQFVRPSLDLRYISPIGRVRMLTELVMISGHTKLFHSSITATSATVATAGIDIGRVKESRRRRCPQPSTSAASKTSAGRDMKCWRSRKVPKAEATPGRIRPA